LAPTDGVYTVEEVDLDASLISLWELACEKSGKPFRALLKKALVRADSFCGLQVRFLFFDSTRDSGQLVIH